MSEKTTKTAVKKTATKTAAKTATKPAVKKPATKKPAAASKSSTASTKTATKKPASKTESKRATKKAENIGALTSTFGLPTSVENEELKKPKITPRQNPAKAKRQSMTEKTSPKSQKATQAFDSIKKAGKQIVSYSPTGLLTYHPIQLLLRTRFRHKILSSACHLHTLLYGPLPPS